MSTTTSTPPKRRKSVFATPTKASSSHSTKQKTPKKTPIKKDMFSPAARKILDKAKGVLTSPRKAPSAQLPQRPSFSSQKDSRTESSVDRRPSVSNLRHSGAGSQRKDGANSGAAVSEKRSSVCASADLSSRLTASVSKDTEKESRSERNKKKLKEICMITLKDRGVGRKDEIFNNCFTRLYTISKSFVKDLKSSQNLREEMGKIVQSHVDLIITFEKNRV